MKTKTRKNLIILRDFLRDHVTDAQFDMGQYRQDMPGGVSAEYYNAQHCGTVGCALGWAPFVDGLKPIPEDFSTVPASHRTAGGKLPLDSLNWRTYGCRVFGNLHQVAAPENVPWDLNAYSMRWPARIDAWNYLFAARWAQFDNTREGFCQRVDALLAAR